MAQWWTYRPSDFLMFSARSYGRLVEAYNRELWPAQPVLMILGLALVATVARDPQRWGRPAAAALALAWAWVAWAFHWERFAAINTAALWLAGAFALQALLLLAVAAAPAARVSLNPATTRGHGRRAPMQTLGLAIALVALLAYPLLALATARGWREAELPGLMPDPTALFTLGVLLTAPLRGRAIAGVVPCIALVIGWTTAWLLWA